MTASISRYLKDFSAPKVELSLLPPRYFPDLDDDFPANGTFAMKPPVQPQIDIDAERREAFAQGRREAEGRAAGTSGGRNCRLVRAPRCRTGRHARAV